MDFENKYVRQNRVASVDTERIEVRNFVAQTGLRRAVRAGHLIAVTSRLLYVQHRRRRFHV